MRKQRNNKEFRIAKSVQSLLSVSVSSPILMMQVVEICCFQPSCLPAARRKQDGTSLRHTVLESSCLGFSDVSFVHWYLYSGVCVPCAEPAQPADMRGVRKKQRNRSKQASAAEAHLSLSTRLNFLAVIIWHTFISQPKSQNPSSSQNQLLTCVLVLCPLTGKPIACLLPLYVPISLSRLMLFCSCPRKSDSSVISASSPARLFICFSPRLPMRAVLWMWNLDISCVQTWGPRP
jgi:hypothetical protein